MALNFHQLHIFYTVAEKGHFSAAAQFLHMTQPAVTMQIQALEEHFGVKLFHRSTKKVELSEAGKSLLPYAKQSIALMKETDASMSSFTHRLKGRLDFAASLTIGEYILPRILKPFSLQYPHISIGLNVINSAQILEKIVNHQLNFGLVEAAVTDPHLHTEPILNDELMLIAPSEHPLMQKDVITIQDAFNYPFILREQGSGTRRVMEEELRAKGIDLSKMEILMELGSTGAVKSAVESGLGITILSLSSVKHEMALGIMKARKIKDLSFVRSFYAIYLNETILPIAAVTFLSFMRENDLSYAR